MDGQGFGYNANDQIGFDESIRETYPIAIAIFDVGEAGDWLLATAKSIGHVMRAAF